MSRRRRSRAAFSLFSFQDIITSVTAILILLVLILTLELVTRRQEAAAIDSTVSRASLQAAAAALEALVGRLSLVAPPTQIRPLIKRTREELDRDVRIVEDQIVQAAAHAEAARAVEARARTLAAAALARLENTREIREGIDRMTKEAAQLEQNASKLAIDNEAEAERLARKQEEIVQQPSSGAELVFNAPKDFNTQPWIAEVSDDGLAIVKLGTNRRQLLGVDLGPGSAIATWISALTPAGDHVLILVRPSGVDNVFDIRASLDEAGIPFGIDFIGEDQVVRDGLGESQENDAGDDAH